MEECKLCGQDSTPWHYIHGHICQDCYARDNWISVKEELPELLEKGCEPVLIACYSPERKIYHISSAVFQRGRFYDPTYNEYIPIDDPYWVITHWMHFPEPPK